MSPRWGGAVLVTVLGGVLLVAAILFAALFGVTLETLAARSAARAALESAALQGALSQAATELVLAGAGAPDSPRVLGPWPHLRVDGASGAVTVVVTPVGPGDVVELEARLAGSARVAPARLVLALTPEPRPLWRP